MNKIQKIAYLIGMMILPTGFAVAALDAYAAEAIIFGFFIAIFSIYILIPYVGMRLSCWIYGIVQFIFKRKIDKWNRNLIILDIPMFFCAFYLLNAAYLEPKKDRQIRTQAEKLRHITLSQPQTISGITMPTGTKIETDFDYYRKQPEPEKFTYVSFPEPIVWNGIPIIDMGRTLDSNRFWHKNREITTESNQQVGIGQWLCKANVNLEWKMLPESPENLPYTQGIESLVYLDYCVLESGQRVSLPTFHLQAHFQLDSGSGIRRKSDTFRDVAKGLWYINIPEKDEIKSAMKMDYDDFEIMTDSNQVVHSFVIELNDAPEKHCGLPEYTVLAWQKSKPNVIQVISDPQKIPKQCWGKKLQMVSVDEIQKAMPQHSEWHFQSAKKRFEQTPAQ